MSKAPKGYTDRNRLQDYRMVFGSVEGQRVLNDLISQAGVLGVITPGDTVVVDPNLISFRDGQRNLVLLILHYMNLKPSDIPQVHKSVLEQFGMAEEPTGA
jgi:hypothetical protein